MQIEEYRRVNKEQKEHIEILNKEIERLIISLQAQEELTMNEHIKVERLNNGLKDIKWYIEKNKTSFSDLYIPASDVVSILAIIDRLLGSDKE